MRETHVSWNDWDDDLSDEHWDEVFRYVRPAPTWDWVDPNNEWGFVAPEPPFRGSITYETLVQKFSGIKGAIIQTREHHSQGRIDRWYFYENGYIDRYSNIGGTAARVVCGCHCSGCKQHHVYEFPPGYKEGMWVNGEWFPPDDPKVFHYSY